MAETRLEEIRKVRLEKLARLRDMGINPYPPSLSKEPVSISNALEKMGETVVVAGRLLGLRSHGNILFADLMDDSGKVQLFFQKNKLADLFNLVELLDIGDFILTEGEVFNTQAGEISVNVSSLELLAKSVRPLPSTWHGLTDVEERYRKRYLDLILNEEVRVRLNKRSEIIESIRTFLNSRNFIEVETPTLQPIYGGGFAKPFVTRHNALNSNFYLRISDEMYLKRLVVGGFEKVYEITKVFRNEGVDRDHNPEFTMFEAQIAYKDYTYGMDLIEEIFENAALKVVGSTTVEYQGEKLEFKRPWKRLKLVEAIKEFTGVNPLEWQILEEAKSATQNMDIPKEKLTELEKIHSIGEVMAFIFEEMVEEKLIQPTIIYDYPTEVSPLAKKCADERFTQRFEMFAYGSELGNNYTELNDPVDLTRRFVEEKEREKAGFEEAHQTDQDYLTAIEYGFPPTCGLGVGIDRMVMMLTNAQTIKEVIAFPTLRPETNQVIKKSNQVKNDVVALDSEFINQYPSASVGYAIITDISVALSNKELEEEKQGIYKMYEGLTEEKILTFPEIESYRKMYQEMGVNLKSRKPSPEALLLRIAEGKDLYTVNTCVDAYNLVVMKHRVSLGAFNLDEMELPVEVKVAEGGEVIDLLGKGETKIRKGEVMYVDQKGPFNLDYNYRDAERTKITVDTKNIVINVDGVFDVDEEKVETSLREAISIIQKYCGGILKKAGIVSANGKLKKLII